MLPEKIHEVNIKAEMLSKFGTRMWNKRRERCLMTTFLSSKLHCREESLAWEDG